MKSNYIRRKILSLIKSFTKEEAAAVLLLAASLLLTWCARNVSGFAQQYSVTVYSFLKNTVGRACGLFPFSLSEAGLYLLSAACVYQLIHSFRQPLFLLKKAFFLSSLLFFIYTINCGINYYRTPFSVEAGFSEKLAEGSSQRDLYELCEFLVQKVNENIPQETDPDRSLSYFQSMGQLGREAMSGLGNEFPQLGGWYPFPKPLINSRLLSVQQLTGIYSPFTIEANYNREIPFYNIPHTICHELSHLKGYMREDEANFIGYLACIGSEDTAFRYSGYLTGWVYAGNALAQADFDGYRRLYGQLDPQAVQDLGENNAFWDRFKGKVAEASAKMNDTYLKAHSQTDGIKSYGRMVDLMLAYYR